MAEQNRCSAQGCEQLSAATLETSAFCREHFISTCYERLDEFAARLKYRPFPKENEKAIRQFALECSWQAMDLAYGVADLNNLARARLLDILFWAGDLLRQLRRSPRKEVSILVRLRWEKRGQRWEEETATRTLSYHGALVDCGRPVEVEDIVVVERLDSGRNAHARVAWHQPKEGGGWEIGIEFLDFDNFWELEWGSAEP